MGSDIAMQRNATQCNDRVFSFIPALTGIVSMGIQHGRDGRMYDRGPGRVDAMAAAFHIRRDAKRTNMMVFGLDNNAGGSYRYRQCSFCGGLFLAFFERLFGYEFHRSGFGAAQ
jgi:hypothetical protein